MGWLEGVLSGYADRHYEIQKEKRAEAELAAEREAKVFDALLNSKYQTIKDYAAAGILDLSNPRRRKGGIAGWMGEIEQTPYLDMIRRTREKFDADPDAARANLIDEYGDNAPDVAPQERGGLPPPTPSVPAASGALPAPAAPSAALPSTSAVTGGPVTPVTPAPTTQGAPPPAPPSPSFPGARPPTSVDPGFYLTPEAMQRMGINPANTDPGFTATDAGLPRVPSRAGNIDPGFVRDRPGVAGGPSGAPPVPPSSLMAGTTMVPPAGPPPRPEAPGAGLPGGTAGTVGRQPPPPPRRTQLPGIFPTQSELALDAARARAAGADQGEQDSYIRVALAQGLTRADGLKMWADNQMKARGGSALQYAPMEYDVRQADGTSQRVLGWVHRATGQYLDMNGQPFSPKVQITKAAPYSAISGDTYYREATAIMGLTPGQVANDPALARQVQAKANQIAAERAGDLTSARGQAAAANPLNAQGRINQMAAWQNRYNAYQAPMRLIEQNVRKMAAMYAELKKKPANEAAWEPFRTSFVHVNENSIVMPSEFGRSDAIGNLVQRAEGKLKQYMEGGGPMTDDLIDAMMDAAAAQWESLSNVDAGFRSQVEEALKDPALVGIRPEQIFGAKQPRFDPWTVARPETSTTNTVVDPKKAGGGGAGGGPTVPGGTGTYWDEQQHRYVTGPKKQ